MKSTTLLCFFLEISFAVNVLGLCTSLIKVVPSDVTFRLYTRSSPTNYTLLQTGNLNGVVLDPSKPCKCIIHGYTGNAGAQWVIDMKDAYLKKGRYNVIAVDWSGPAFQTYSESAASTKEVGKYVALLIIDMKNTLGVPFKNIHLIGHSLGAHVAGSCGKYILAKYKALIGRITGLDPAHPFFCDSTGDCRDSRLRPGFAAFTDVIHTDGYEFGCFNVSGDVDFYPNGGKSLQPGCKNADLSDLMATLVPFKNIHLIGHSLGAHVAGSCGKYLLAIYKTLIERITGLDPAHPFFCDSTGDCRDSRLRPGFAAFTDVIHTDGYDFGCFNVSGDVDFYPNGGKSPQPGCKNADLSDLIATLGCSHNRAIYYFIESICSRGFISRKCNCYGCYKLGFCKNNRAAVMGENVNHSLKGKYYLKTNAQPPYARYGAL